MKTIQQMKTFYANNKNKYTQEQRNKINYLFKILMTPDGDCGHLHDLESLLYKKIMAEVGLLEMFENFNEWRPNKNRYFANLL